ncbi:MAG: hypothetical protein ACSHX6_08370 [Akkermansiaceae bacterium]
MSHRVKDRLVIMLGGVAFIIAGIWAGLFAEPGSEADSMTKIDQVYFGVIFISLGLGLFSSVMYRSKR